jgi:C_GCAxxG_C_C family probable redox protein
MTLDLHKHVGERAAELFESGWNCAESVFLAVCEALGVGEPPVEFLTALGGGFGSRKTCGSLTGAIVALGLRYGRKQIDPAAKKLAYVKANELYRSFRQDFHSTECWELTNCEVNENERKRICAPLVRRAAELASQALHCQVEGS